MIDDDMQKKIEFLDWELGVFFHFGIRTFFEGHSDWDMQQMDLKAFNPKKLDCDSWIQTVREAGAKYAILVCKHHDGFANWPSAYTEYSVKNTPWKNGKGDVVAEFVQACRKYDVKVGLYYSPAQFGASAHNSDGFDSEAYTQYFINQISELLSGYGKIDYLWFDGCGSEGMTFDKKKIVDTIYSLQPEIRIFNMWHPDTRWIGNEQGIAPIDNFNRVHALHYSVLTDRKDTATLEEKTVFLPGECDCRIREKNWFFSRHDAHTLKSVDALCGLYYMSVGRGANLLINIAPDDNGLLPVEDAKRFVAFGKEIQRRFQNPFPVREIVRHKNKLLVYLQEKQLVNTVVLKEDLLSAEEISSFEISAGLQDEHFATTVYLGRTIGHKHIAAFPPLYADFFEIAFEGDSTINKVSLFHTKDDKRRI